MTKYERLTAKLNEAARRPEKVKDRRSAMKRSAACVKLLRAAGFKDFIVEAGLYFDGKRIARVTETVTVFGVWTVTAYIETKPSTQHTLALFGKGN